jgi:hypothetical protein
MNPITIPIIVLIVIVIGVIYFMATRKPSKDSGHITPPHGRIIVSKKCPATIDTKALVECDPKDPNSCNTCSDGLHACFTITDDEPYNIDINGSKLKVPNGNWCLPAKIKTLPCNEFSGFPILAKLSNTEYVWKCQCKYPSLFTNAGEFGDCTSEVACGAQLNSNNHLVCPPNSEACTPGTKWLDNPTWDPTYGACSCDEKLKFVDKSNRPEGVWDKECLSDSCYPGVTEGESCKCPDKVQTATDVSSYIRCPDDVKPTERSLCSVDIECIKDPCNPGGYYDPATGKCVCPIDGYAPALNSISPVGWICDSPCGPEANPCAERGDCILVDGKAQCTNCHFPWIQILNDDTCGATYPNLCGCHQRVNGEKCHHAYECMTHYCSGKCSYPPPPPIPPIREDVIKE